MHALDTTEEALGAADVSVRGLRPCTGWSGGGSPSDDGFISDTKKRARAAKARSRPPNGLIAPRLPRFRQRLLPWALLERLPARPARAAGLPAADARAPVQARRAYRDHRPRAAVARAQRPHRRHGPVPPRCDVPHRRGTPDQPLAVAGPPGIYARLREVVGDSDRAPASGRPAHRLVRAGDGGAFEWAGVAVECIEVEHEPDLTSLGFRVRTPGASSPTPATPVPARPCIASPREYAR